MNSLTLSLYFLLYLLEFVVLKKFLKNPIHPSLECFSLLSIAFIFLVHLLVWASLCSTCIPLGVFFFSSVEFTSFYSLLTLSFHSSVRIPYTRELYRRWAYFRPLFVDQVLVVFLYYYCCFNNLHQRVFHGHHLGRVKDSLLKWGDLFLEKQAAWTCGKKHGSTWWWLKVMTSSLNKEQWSR